MVLPLCLSHFVVFPTCNIVSQTPEKAYIASHLPCNLLLQVRNMKILTICTVNVPCEIWPKGNVISSCQLPGSSRSNSIRVDLFHDYRY